MTRSFLPPALFSGTLLQVSVASAVSGSARRGGPASGATPGGRVQGPGWGHRTSIWRNHFWLLSRERAPLTPRPSPRRCWLDPALRPQSPAQTPSCGGQSLGRAGRGVPGPREAQWSLPGPCSLPAWRAGAPQALTSRPSADGARTGRPTSAGRRAGGVQSCPRQ